MGFGQQQKTKYAVVTWDSFAYMLYLYLCDHCEEQKYYDLTNAVWRSKLLRGLKKNTQVDGS